MRQSFKSLLFEKGEKEERKLMHQRLKEKTKLFKKSEKNNLPPVRLSFVISISRLRASHHFQLSHLKYSLRALLFLQGPFLSPHLELRQQATRRGR